MCLPSLTHVVLCSRTVGPWRIGDRSQKSCLEPLWLCSVQNLTSEIRRGKLRKAAHPRKREKGSSGAPHLLLEALDRR